MNPLLWFIGGLGGLLFLWVVVETFKRWDGDD